MSVLDPASGKVRPLLSPRYKVLLVAPSPTGAWRVVRLASSASATVILPDGRRITRRLGRKLYDRPASPPTTVQPQGLRLRLARG